MAEFPRRPQGQKQEVSRIQRGEIYVCALDPTAGHEIKKTRPALIIQNNTGNRYSPLTIVAAITSTISPVPYPVRRCGSVRR
jgi:mRNA interferase MazF